MSHSRARNEDVPTRRLQLHRLDEFVAPGAPRANSLVIAAGRIHGLQVSFGVEQKKKGGASSRQRSLMGVPWVHLSGPRGQKEPITGAARRETYLRGMDGEAMQLTLCMAADKNARLLAHLGLHDT